MKALALALGCLLVAAKATIACSVVQVVETLPSSPSVRLTVLKDGTPQQNATLVVTLQINAQKVGPALTTDTHGNAELRNLVPGTYCISATADPRLGADLCLVVSNADDRKRSEFSLKLAPLPPPPPTLAEQLEQAAKSPPQVRVREFEGIVTDVTGAPIPRAALVVYVDRSPKKPSMVRLEADEGGRFFAPLNPGSYTAAFQSPGFRTRFVSFEIGPDESQESVPVVLQVGSCP
jgi:Carboxypeptidase regulatory-like domain